MMYVGILVQNAGEEADAIVAVAPGASAVKPAKPPLIHLPAPKGMPTAIEGPKAAKARKLAEAASEKTSHLHDMFLGKRKRVA